ncbi:hypothetical protein PG984_012276 [Apiospora sp. TS-2023a]
MTHVLLFYTAEEAKPMVPKLINVTKESDYWNPYLLVESRQGPTEGREHLAEGEAFKNDFLNASVEVYGAFQLQQQAKTNAIEANTVVLLDARSA